jgi:hypothetical protein
MLISSEYFKSRCDLEIICESDFPKITGANIDGQFVFLKSSVANNFLRFLKRNDDVQPFGTTLILHGDDPTISLIAAQELTSKGFDIWSVNWLGEQSLVRSIPIGIPTFDRLRGVTFRDYKMYFSMLEMIAKNDVKRDISLYANFDITTNLPERKNALLFSLRRQGSYVPVDRIGLIENLEIMSRSEFVLSPPGAGPDCFRTWEALYLGVVPIVLRSHWPFNHIDLPVLVVDSFENLQDKITNYKNNPITHNNNWEENFRLP